MKLIGCLSWWQEPPGFLAELVASLGRAGVDHLVAVDGSYALMAGGEPHSGSEQAQIVTAAAVGAGMGVTVHVPREPWFGNEVEKRSFLFRAAHLVAEPGKDWLVVADGDEVWESTSALRDRLEQTEHDIAEVVLAEVAPQGAQPMSTSLIRKCFRAHEGGIRVVGHHARYVDGDERVLWDAGRAVPGVPCEQLWDVRVRHRPAGRPEWRLERRAGYYRTREDLKVEA